MPPECAVPAAGLAIRDPIPWAHLIELSEEAERSAYQAFLVPEIAGRESFSTLAAIASLSSSMRLGQGVIPMTSREPFLTAMATATVQELSGGRFILGLGSGPVGLGAIEGLRRYVKEVRRILTGATVQWEGSATSLWLLPGEPVPIWLGALGDGMFKLVGELADGVVMNMCTPERVAHAREVIRRSAIEAGRDPSAITVGVFIRSCVDQDEDAALAAMRSAVRYNASFPPYARQYKAMGLDADSPDALVRAVTLIGERAAARARLDEYRRAGADLPIVYPIPAGEPVASIRQTLLSLAPLHE